jgi:hypothetical protein
MIAKEYVRTMRRLFHKKIITTLHSAQQMDIIVAVELLSKPESTILSNTMMLMTLVEQ